MSIKKFTFLESEAVIMPSENIDTDQIIPARFLKTTSREGFGEKLFYDLRYKKDGSKVEDFALNCYPRDCKILVAGRNFGCGSSREHAAWAIGDYGFRAVVSSFFADIFRNNALNNGVLPVQVSEQFLNTILQTVSSGKNTNAPNKKSASGSNSSRNTITLIIDIMKKEISISGTSEKDNIEFAHKENFQINSYKQNCLINGHDDIDFLVSNLQEIEKYEQFRLSAY